MENAATLVRDLRAEWSALKAENSHLRIRDAAKQLGVSEAELLILDLGASVRRLTNDWEAILTELPKLGQIMALTRNEAVVIEKDGAVNPPQFFKTHGGSIGQVVGKEIDLRIFLSHWAFGFVVVQETPRGTMRSLQFFDKYGEAVHKIYLRPASNLEAFETLVSESLAENQTEGLVFEAVAHKPVEKENASPDVEGFLAGWGALKDTHDFFMMLRKFGVTRYQSMLLGEGKFTRRVSTAALQTALKAAAETQLPIMAFVGNDGCIEIHTGVIKKLVPLENWFNVMDEGFNLHVNESLITDAFVVEKPTTDGTVTSIEFYDEARKIVLQLFGERKPGKPELEGWRELVKSISETA